MEDREHAINELLNSIYQIETSNPTSPGSSSHQVNNTKNPHGKEPLILQDKALYADIQSIIGIGQKNSKLYNKLGNIYRL